MNLNFDLKNIDLKNITLEDIQAKLKNVEKKTWIKLGVSVGAVVFFLIILLGSVALPLTNGFVGEFLLLVGLYQYNAVIAGFAGVSVILGAVYMLRSYQAVMLGETNSITSGFGDLEKSEKAVLFIICAAIIVFGVYPKPLMDISAPAIHQLIEILKVS